MGNSPSVRVHCEGQPGEGRYKLEMTITQIQSAAYCKRTARSVGARGRRQQSLGNPGRLLGQDVIRGGRIWTCDFKGGMRKERKEGSPL